MSQITESTHDARRRRAGNTAYELHGAGPAVVLIHGLGLNRRMWRWQIDALAPHFSVACYDLLGHGESAKPAGPYRMDDMVEQLSDLLRALAVDRAAVVGFSLGGLIARAFALAHPRRISALAILNSPHARSSAQRAKVMRRVRQAERGGAEATVEDALRRWFTATFSASHPQVLDEIRRWIVANDRDVYPAVYRLLAEGDIGLEEAISGIDCPVLVLTAEMDLGNSPQMAAGMCALMPRSRCVVLPGLKHMAPIEDPRAVNASLLPFLIDNASR